MVYLVKIVMFIHHSGNKLELLTYRVCDGAYTFFSYSYFLPHLKKLTNVKKDMNFLRYLKLRISTFFL